MGGTFDAEHLLHTLPPLPPPLPVYPLSQVLQIAERFYQTLLPPIIARGIAKQLGASELLE